MPAYSRILLPWDSQPQEAVGVDGNNPITNGLAYLGNAAARYQNVVSGKIYTTPAGLNLSPGKEGIAYGMAATGFTLEDFVFGGTSPITCVALVDANTSSASGAAIAQGAEIVLRFGTSGKVEFILNTFTGANDRIAVTASGGIPGRHFMAGSYGPSGLISVYGDQAVATVTPSGNYANEPSPFALFGNSSLASFTAAKIYLAAIWARELSSDEINALFANPWQLFATRSIWVPVSAGGGGTSISGALGTAVASGFTGAVNANRSIAGALGTATASGFTGAVSNSTNTAITGALGVATASGFKGTVSANRGIAGALGTAVASGFTGAVTNDNSTTIAGALGTATASGFTGAITWNRYISGLLGVAQASGFAGGVQNGAAPVVASGGGIYPTPRRKTKQEIDEDRKRLGILPDETEVQTGIVEVLVKRPKITLEQLIGKPAADTHRADMERASAAHKLRKRRQDDDLLMMM